MPQGARRSGRGGGGGRGRNKDTSRRPASGRGATKARRTSSGGTGRCESEASIPPRPSEYRKFDSATSNVRGVMIGSLADERGTFYPCAFIDGHPSRVDCDFLEYVNLAESRFCVVLGAPDATNYWQHHDSSEMNGGYKSELAQAKSDLILRKRLACMPAEIEQVEIVIIARPAIQNSYLVKENAVKSLLHRGLYPLNRALLDHPDIFATASEAEQKERTAVRQCWGIESRSDVHGMVAPAQQDLLSLGSASLLPGGQAAAAVASAAESLNLTGRTSRDIMSLLQSNASRTQARQEQLAADAANPNSTSPEELQRRYSEATRLTTGRVFRQGDGILCPATQGRQGSARGR